jgi:hypothetical protein
LCGLCESFLKIPRAIQNDKLYGLAEEVQGDHGRNRVAPRHQIDAPAYGHAEQPGHDGYAAEEDIELVPVPKVQKRLLAIGRNTQTNQPNREKS